MRNKKLLFFIIIIFFILLMNSTCFAINVTIDGSTVQLPDFTPNPSYGNGPYYFIYKQNNNAKIYLYSLDTNGVTYYQESDDRLQTRSFSIYSFTPNNNTQWVYETGLSGPANLYLDDKTILYSNFNILYENSDRVYFADSTQTPEPEPEVSSSIDTLYIGDIPEEFCYAEFTSDYVTLYNKSSANNEDLPYYRIYFIENAFYYDTGTAQFDSTVNFQKINVTNNFFYRRDFANICLTTFIIVLFFLWVTNLFTSLIYKGGVLRGLL